MTEQKKNVVQGDMAGGDIHKTTNILIGPATFMSQLQERFEKELANNSEFRAVVDQLEFYKAPIDAEPIGLEKKLELGDRQSYIPVAIRSKELFAKLMTKHNLSQAAQILIAHCLGTIEGLFQAQIAPLIKNGATLDAVDAALITEVIRPVLDGLETNFLWLTPQDIKGMVYYLTANCFLWWHPNTNNGNLSPSA
jgi:hypothetical protein